MAKSSSNGFNEFCPFLINQLASDTSLLMFFIFFTEIVLMAGQYATIWLKADGYLKGT
jgi:hypothetical protein